MHFHIEGLRPYDGDHPIDLETFTNRELHTIKEMSGVRAAELDEAFRAGDNDLVVAFCVIALKRAGFQVDHNALWDAPIGAIQFVVEDDASPPDETNSEGGTDKPSASGEPSDPDGASRANGLSPTGSPSSATGSDSALVTSVS